MSLSFALFNAASGLRAQGRAAELVSGNVANALTPGYARRELLLTTDIVGANGGVRVAGVQRVVDPAVLSDRRLADADAGSATVLAGGLARIEAAIGEPGALGSLSERVSRFASSLIEAASRPDAELRLSEAVSAARGIAGGINAVGTEIQRVRTDADTAIGQMVGQVNAALRQVDALNEDILRLGAKSRDSSVLQEQRQQAIDAISDILPIREVVRANGEVALYTPAGATLLDGRPFELGFDANGFVEPWMTQAGGALSGLTIGGIAVDTDGSRSLLGDGALKAQFTLRDVAGPEAQAALDALARDLIERYQDAALDPTLPAGPPAGPGLFTDATGAFDASVAGAEEGLAQRIGVNAAVDPTAGGEVWRLRDGLGAATPGAVGDSALIAALTDRLDLPRSPASGPQAGQPRGFSDQVALFLSGVASTRQARDTEAAFEVARVDTLRQREAAGGVDTDDEMQKLLVIEQAYSANARVIQTIDALMEELRRI